MQSVTSTLLSFCFFGFACFFADCFIFNFRKHSQSSPKQTVMKQSIWDSTKVEYFNPDYAEVNECANARPLPLFLLGGPLFPGGLATLNVFEMRYRTMMFDCAKSDDMFGHIHVDRNTGNIAKYGTLVKIIKRELLEDGCQVINVEGLSRFRVRKIISTLPYCKAEVEPDVIDNIPSNENAARSVELKAYNSLKYFMRLISSGGKESFIPTAVKRWRPTLTNPDSHFRRTYFSFALSSMIRMPEKDSQMLLQTLDLELRLEAQNNILSKAAEDISAQLIDANMLTEAERDAIKSSAESSDFDADILPPDAAAKEAAEEKDEWDISNMG